MESRGRVRDGLRSSGEQRHGHGAIGSLAGADACSPILARSRPVPRLGSAPAATVRRLMATRPARRTRVTLRCVRDDLDLPPVKLDLGSLDYPLVAEARRVAPSAPRGQKRILSIEHPLAYRLRHGRWRGATWLESEAASGFPPERTARKARATTPTSTSLRCTTPVGYSRTTTIVSATRSSATPASSTLPRKRFRRR